MLSHPWLTGPTQAPSPPAPQQLLLTNPPAPTVLSIKRGTPSENGPQTPLPCEGWQHQGMSPCTTVSDESTLSCEVAGTTSDGRYVNPPPPPLPTHHMLQCHVDCVHACCRVVELFWMDGTSHAWACELALAHVALKVQRGLQDGGWCFCCGCFCCCWGAGSRGGSTPAVLPGPGAGPIFVETLSWGAVKEGRC